MKLRIKRHHSTDRVGRLFLGAAAALAGWVAVRAYPDLRRYLRTRAM
jgi:hypothetical protein